MLYFNSLKCHEIDFLRFAALLRQKKLFISKILYYFALKIKILQR